MKKTSQLSPDRIKVLERISEYEKKGGDYFFENVEDDPPSRTLKPEDVDYLHESFKYKINGFLCRTVERLGKPFVKRKYDISVYGSENLKGIEGGAVFTSNHFAMLENVAVNIAASKANGKHRFYKIVREGNYFMPGVIGWLLKYCDTMPLSSSLDTMKLLDKAIAKILSNGDFILIYPEKAMWWNYQKPRPYKLGAFRYAAKNNVPVVPCFITLHRKDKSREMLPDNVKYKVHIMPPIYPDENLNVKANAVAMLEKNASLTKELYEQVYNKKLEY